MYLIPGTSHVISWQKQNLLDTATYYVQAVVRDTRADQVLATLNLNDQGNGRFTRSWTVPQDPSGQGREISIEKTIYTDANYSEVSATYGRWTEQFIIYNLRAPQHAAPVTVPEIDYERIQAMIDASVAKVPQTDLSEVVGELGGVKKTLGDRLRELFRVGERASELEKYADQAKAETKRMLDAAQKNRESVRAIEQAVAAGTQAIEQAAEDGSQRIMRAATLHQADVVQAVNAELDTMAGKLTDVVHNTGKEMVDNMVAAVNAELDKPVVAPLGDVGSFTVQRPKRQQAPDNSERAQRLLNYGV